MARQNKMVKLLTIAGLGPGDSNMVTPNVQEAISSATDIVGYIPYVARIPPRDGLVLHASDNRVEIERAELALDLAASGKKVLIVSSGDPGVFAMAAAVFEILDKNLSYLYFRDNLSNYLNFPLILCCYLVYSSKLKFFLACQLLLVLQHHFLLIHPLI